LLLPFTNGLIPTSQFDPEMAALADRHYTRQTIGARQFAGNGEKIILRDAAGLILFVWLRQDWRMDKLSGFNCQWFRNEGHRLGSEIILEAERFAVERWGPGLAFTFVDPAKIRSQNPGCCFKKAFWKPIPGFTPSGKIVLIKGLH
jgi:hypothetical protein